MHKVQMFMVSQCILSMIAAILKVMNQLAMVVDISFFDLSLLYFTDNSTSWYSSNIIDKTNSTFLHEQTQLSVSQQIALSIISNVLSWLHYVEVEGMGYPFKALCQYIQVYDAAITWNLIYFLNVLFLQFTSW